MKHLKKDHKVSEIVKLIADLICSGAEEDEIFHQLGNMVPIHAEEEGKRKRIVLIANAGLKGEGASWKEALRDTMEHMVICQKIGLIDETIAA